MSEFSLAQLAETLGAQLHGDPTLKLKGGAPLSEAGAGQLSFLSNLRYQDQVPGCAAGAILLSAKDYELLKHLPRKCWLVLADPYAGFAQALSLFHPPRKDWGQGIHESAVIHPGARIHPSAVIGAHAVIEDRVVVGEESVILANCMLYRGVQIGRDCLLHASVSIRENCILGDRVLLHNGAVIGSDGFGFAPDAEGGIRKIPQTGIVRVGNDVEIGANCTIDRATMGVTQIGDHCKLDNLVHVAHNVSIGPATMIAGQAGIAGSTQIGAGCILGGQAAISGHLSLGRQVRVGGQSGVTTNVGDGETVAGFPAVKHREFLAQSAAVRKLPRLREEFKKLQSRISKLEAGKGNS